MRVLILLAIIGAACALPKKDARIVGGLPTAIENYPFVASLQHGYFGIIFAHQCGGTLVSSIAIVSVAHCFSDQSTSSWRVRLGSSLASLGGSEHEVASLVIHPSYNSRLILNNVAVLKLSQHVEFSNRINMAYIAGPNYLLPDNTRLFAAGYGATQFQGQLSEILHHVDVNVVNQQVCADHYKQLKTINGKENWPDVTPEMLCTGAIGIGNKGTCKGDEGGPIVHAGNVIVGIDSWAFECGHETYPSISVRVPSYASWIFDAAS